MTFKKKHNLFMFIYALLIALVIVLVVNCSGSRSGKQQSEIQLPEPAYSFSPDSLPFRFDVSDQAVFTAREHKEDEYFCDVFYPGLNAQLYCTWRRITPGKLNEISEESRKLAFQHIAMATNIREERHDNDFARVFALIYNIDGNVATPLQLTLTDSTSYFLNASLYFNATPNADSIAPYLDYIRKDVYHLIETFSVKPD